VIAKYVERLLGGSSVSERASSREDTAPMGTPPTSVSEEDS